MSNIILSDREKMENIERTLQYMEEIMNPTEDGYLNVWDYMENKGLDFYEDIPESDYKYLGLNADIVKALTQWEEEVQVWHDCCGKDMDEPMPPTFLPRVKYIAAKK